MITIYVADIKEFFEKIDNKDLELSTNLVSVVLNNLDSKEDTIHAIDVYINDTDTILELTVERADFIDTLEKNLLIQEKHEEYEKCSQIYNAIQLLKSKENETV